MKKFNTTALAQAAVLLAICIISQFFKNLSVYITGPIINACIIVCVLTAGMGWAIALSIITPVTSYFITGSPIMAAIPLIMPCIMVGNAILAVCVGLLKDKLKFKFGLPVSMIIGSVLKAIFMGVVISLIIVPNMLPEKMAKMMPTIQKTFSITQLITALIGSVIAYIIWIPLKTMLNNIGE